MKKKKLVKQALKNPHLFSPAELAYFDRWLHQRKLRKKTAKIELSKKENS